MEYSEKEVQRALEKIMNENGGKLPSQMRRPNAPPGSRLSIVTNAGTFECGAVFEAETVKGGKNYVIFGMEYMGWVYYFHGDRAKKISAQKFKSTIDYGDLVPVPKKSVDPERIALCVLGLSAMAHGLAFNDYLKVLYGYGDGSQAG